MSKTHFQLTKETLTGLGIFAGVVVVFIVNMYFVLISLIEVYGASKSTSGASAIDDTVLSQAIKVLNLETPE